MQWRLRPVLSQGDVCCVVSGSLFILALTCLPGTVAAQASTDVPLYSHDFSDADELPPLTTAQQEARALATVLIGKKEGTTTSLPIAATPLVFFSEQSLRPGKRLVVILGTWKRGQVRLVSGQQTFASMSMRHCPYSQSIAFPLWIPGTTRQWQSKSSPSKTGMVQ